ncbi:unnamed protein product [Schistosoma rodhaini]|uniref:tRNA (guanine(9)-N(1))-methyltransferase n=2 Tax=Schistosoma rodhaini TaxID=6188 RepID=A0AA85GJ67_9TREM|nr:unnamed protein product [Schistosoma rodhaini]CAH8648554.1 unnamed protein product [Schistosoma rodhaini]
MNTEHLDNMETETIPITNEEGLSKRPNRKLIQYLKRKEARREIRKVYKERRKIRQQQQQQEQQSSSCVVHNVDNDTYVSTENLSIPKNTLTSHKSECYKRLKMSDSLCQTKVVIDCSYDHLMSFKDICKLANQVANCYSFNRRAKHPVQLYITGLGPCNTIETNINDKDISTGDNLLSVDKCKSIRLYDRLKLCNCDSWDVNLCEDDFTKLFPTDKIVYLCAESEYTLPESFNVNDPSNATTNIDDASNDNTTTSNNINNNHFNQDDIYVIGGLIDHNHLKGYCYNQAIRNGYRTARLPIKEIQLNINGRLILSTLHVFQSLCPVLNGTMTWLESLKDTIPSRKLIQ